ncbi:hypothetical protein [Pseudomarimonas salicorniae]|uniref:Thioredoxin n=1 Tax=Pseudomarimonas salicorniae TaxID=2933270 RepID=A0ABT0GLA5_9GAMM|nr:hypothetical protein [Lysobacter sp. CAU 1642]MCK7595331.1 hypothetical protein [Lysobacter sp. CAU 1642]
MQDPTRHEVRRNRLFKRLGVAAVLVALVGVALLSLPRAFDTDLGKIGSGKQALVFVYDPNLVVSNQQTRVMDEVRELHGDALHFLVADVGHPDTRHFLTRHQARPIQLLLFSADGRELQRMQGLVPAEALLAAIKATSAEG